MFYRSIRQTLAPVLCFALFAIGTPALAAETLKIGVSLPLSGDAAILSRQFLAGAELAVDALAPDNEVELVEVDDGCDPDLAELAAEDLQAAGVSIVTGFLCNNSAAAVAMKLADTGVPIVIAGARSDYVLEEGRDKNWNVWRMAPGENYGANAAFELLADRWQSRPWAAVDDGTIYGRTLSETLRARMEESGLAPQMVETIRPGASNKTSLVRRLREAGIAAVFVAAGAEDTAEIWKTTGEVEFEMEVAGGEALAQLPWIEIAGDLRDGLLAIKEPAPDQLPAYASLSTDMLNAEIEPEPYAFLGYAAMELVMAAIRSTPEQTTEVLGNTVFRTVLGIVKFDSLHRNQVNNYQLYEWRDSEFQLVVGEEP